ncbi:MAG: hypothetical protein CR979_00680, partial [Propionibacterium sp.]
MIGRAVKSLMLIVLGIVILPVADAAPVNISSFTLSKDFSNNSENVSIFVEGDSAPKIADQYLAHPYLARSWQRLQTELSGSAGVTVKAVNGGPEIVFGNVQSAHSRSTAKVPVAIAALRHNFSKANRQRAQLAIQTSSNHAAERLWRSFGNRWVAGAATQKVLRSGDDQSTKVGRAWSVFHWSNEGAVTFAANLACMTDPAAVYVYDQMGNIHPEQSWGLGRISDSHFKGGWMWEKKYALQRQFGVFPKGDGSEIAVSMLVQAKNLHSGQNDLDLIAAWLYDHRDLLPGGKCSQSKDEFPPELVGVFRAAQNS